MHYTAITENYVGLMGQRNKIQCAEKELRLESWLSALLLARHMGTTPPEGFNTYANVQSHVLMIIQPQT